MRYSPLGRSGISVSELCLGTMTFGEQNSERQSHALMDQAFSSGINFFDAAEMYPIPASAETYGRTESIIGGWLQKRHCRQKLVIASKVIGQADDWLPHIRGGRARLDEKNITQALEGSLRRLQTEYIDLYQIHWPDRNTNFFGKLGYQHLPDESPTEIEETLSVLGKLVASGKIRSIGISNETPWGVMQYLSASEARGLPRIVSIQNPYNLLNRSFEVGLSEISLKEDIGLLAYSPMAFGVLSGKYLAHPPADGRLSLFPQYQRYTNQHAIAATKAYVALAGRHALSPAQMALAYVTSRSFVCANIIGATTPEQLGENLASLSVALTEEVLEEIEIIHQQFSNPCP